MHARAANRALARRAESSIRVASVWPALFQQQNGGCRDDGTSKRHVTGAAQRTGGKDNDSSDLGRAIDVGSTPATCRETTREAEPARTTTASEGAADSHGPADR